VDLNALWFWLVGVLFIGYAILDGFDLGVGVLHFFTRTNEERRITINAIAPVWDGNEVWLLTGGGALFAAFPVVYATVFSGFYLALMLLLVALIFRAVAMEFRGKVDSHNWRRFWDWSFSLGSLLPPVLFGVAFGNILRGIPVDGAQTFTGTFLGLLNPYALLVGIVTLVLFTMHGSTYLLMKTDGDLRERVKRWSSGLWIAFVVLYVTASIATFFVSPFLFVGTLNNPVWWLLCLLALGGLIVMPFAVRGGRYFRAFLASSATVAATFALSALSLFPKLVPSSTDPRFSLTAYNASSSQQALSATLIIALAGMPLVIAYTIFIYLQFKGKVTITEESY
jgi:cytochrome d ubiquinol oxidase subunit II